MSKPDHQPAAGRRRLSVDARREQLLALGVAAFSAEAYDQVAIDAIAARAGISKGLLYHYFPNKRAFFVACVKQAAADMLALTAREGLDLAMSAFLDYVQAHRLPYRNLLRGGGQDPEVAAVIDDTRSRLLARLTEGLGLKPDAAGRLALRGWLGFVEAVTVTWLDEAGDQEPLPVATVQDLCLQALHGILPFLEAS